VVLVSWFDVREIVNTWQSSSKIGSNCGATKYIVRGEDAHFRDVDFGDCALLTEMVGQLSLREKCLLICNMSCKH